MAPQPSTKKKRSLDQSAHGGAGRPQSSNTTAVSADGQNFLPSTPVQQSAELPRRSARRGDQKVEFQKLPGTQWDELDIERQRDRPRGRETVSSSAATVSKGSDLIPRTGQILHSAQRTAEQPGPYSLESTAESSGQVSTAASSPVSRRHPNSSTPGRRQSPSGQRDPSPAEGGDRTLAPRQRTESPVTSDSLPIMARRPARNQLEIIAEMRETIHESLLKLSDIQEKQGSLGEQIVALEEELRAKENDGVVTLEETKRLDELYREKVKLTEQELGILHNPPDDVINKVGILKALVSQEDTQAPGRGSAASKQRGSKRSTVESEAATVDSPGPSPSEVRSSDQLRRVKGQGQRSSSVASQTPRDSTSKLDDGSEGSRTGVTAERVKLLVLHAEVAYRQSKTTHDSDGERIHCTINGIRKDKASGRAIYDIKDKDESENLLYTAKAEDLLPIPASGSQLPAFSPSKRVIALYPGTTTFYNAQVISLFAKRDVYSLKFEGEENEKEVKEVERRYVLDTKAK